MKNIVDEIMDVAKQLAGDKAWYKYNYSQRVGVADRIRTNQQKLNELLIKHLRRQTEGKSKNNLLEIELKFLVSALPDDINMPLLTKAKFNQSYISTSPEIRIVECIYESAHKFKLTYKSQGGAVREELEIFIPENLYKALLAVVDGKPITKNYHSYHMGNYIFQTGIVDEGTTTEFIYAEIEFKSVEEMEAFNEVVPYMLEDVTNNPYYKMANYWDRTRPKFEF